MNLLKIFILCFVLSSYKINCQLTAIIKYEFYSPITNYSNKTHDTKTFGSVSSKGSQYPIYNAQAFTLVDSDGRYDACRPTINTNFYSNGVAIIQRGGDCTFSVKISRAKQFGAKAVIIYDPRNNGQDTLDMLQNNSDVLSLYVQRAFGSILFSLANDKQTHLNITMEPVNTYYDDPNRGSGWFGTRGATIFIAVSICILVLLCISWFVFYYCQRYRSRTAKDRLQNRLTNAAKKALTKIPLITITENSATDETCVICLDGIKVGDAVRQLICSHRFHQSCVDPWLINHRHCPLCNIDILSAYGVSVPTIRNHRRSIAPETPMSINYVSIATTAATSIIEQNPNHSDQRQQPIIHNVNQPIPTISGSIKDENI